jgi:hypothetical protein
LAPEKPVAASPIHDNPESFGNIGATEFTEG